MKMHLLMNNGSKAKLIDKSFVRTQRIDTFKSKKQIKLTLGNKKVVQKLDSACLVDIHIGNHHKQIFCYMARLDVYTVVLGDRCLQTHNPAINWKNCTTRFNLASCIESGCLAHSVLCIQFAVSSKSAKNRIGMDKLTAMDPESVDIKPINAEHFFQMARQKNHKGYIWIPRMLSTDCTNKRCTKNSSHVAR